MSAFLVPFGALLGPFALVSVMSAQGQGGLVPLRGPFAATASFAFMGAVNIWGALETAGADRGQVPGNMAYLMLLGSFGVWLTLFPVLLLACVIGLFFFRPRPNPYGGQA